MLFVNYVIAKSFREKPVVILETTPSQKRAELNSIPKPESEGKLVNQAAKVGIIRILIFYLLATSLHVAFYFI